MMIGTVPYSNSLPLTTALRQKRVALPPNLLEKALLDGEIDVGLVPTAGILRHGFHAYPEAGLIGCDGEVKSVGLFVREGLTPEEIGSVYYDAESSTSARLARVILHDLYGRNLRSIRNVPLSLCGEADAQLLIGDKALFFSEKGYAFHDLGELWKRLTGHGFVFACWASRRALKKSEIENLSLARDEGLAHLDKLGADLPEARRRRVLDYLADNIVYRLTPSLEKGRTRFAERLKALDLLDEPKPDEGEIFPEYAAAG